MYLKTNRCSILLTLEESNFVKENINKRNLTKKSVKNAITKLYYNSSKRYFSKRHINEITENLYNDMLSEVDKNLSEVGRNYRSTKNLSSDSSYAISDSEILNKKGIVKTEVGVCVNSGSDIVTLFYNNKTNKILYFDSPDEANNFIKTLRYKNL